MRRAPALQQTADAKPPQRADERARRCDKLGVAEGAQVKVRQGSGEAVLTAAVDAACPAGVVRIAAAHPSTCGLGGLSGPDHRGARLTMDAIRSRPVEALLGPAWPAVWTLAKIVVIAVPLILCVAYLTLASAR